MWSVTVKMKAWWAMLTILSNLFCFQALVNKIDKILGILNFLNECLVVLGCYFQIIRPSMRILVNFCWEHISQCKRYEVLVLLRWKDENSVMQIKLYKMMQHAPIRFFLFFFFFKMKLNYHTTHLNIPKDHAFCPVFILNFIKYFFKTPPPIYPWEKKVPITSIGYSAK